jgi:hypothetical protein
MFPKATAITLVAPKTTANILVSIICINGAQCTFDCVQIKKGRNKKNKFDLKKKINLMNECNLFLAFTRAIDADGTSILNISFIVNF